MSEFCDVLGCSDDVTGAYLAKVNGRLVEFGLCEAHYAVLEAGKRPVIIEGPRGPALLLEE